MGPDDTIDSNLNDGFTPLADDYQVQGDFIMSLFQDNWGLTLDGSMPTYGGLGMGDEFSSSLPG